MGTFRFRAICVYKRKEIPPPIFGGRLFETISGYFPNPAIPPYNIRTLHFVECRLCRSQQSVGCDSGGGQSIMEIFLRRHIFFVGPPVVRWVDRGPTSRWPNERWSDNQMFSWCNMCRHHVLIRQNQSQETRFDDFLALAPVFEKTKPRKLDFITFSHWLKKSTKLVPADSIWWLSSLGCRSRQNESQETRFNEFAALAQEVGKTSPWKLDLIAFWPWLQTSRKPVQGGSIW